jgi:hypothetical protein
MMSKSHPINKPRSNWFAFLFEARLMDQDHARSRGNGNETGIGLLAGNAK